ncbi:MAG TPA: mRNA surveillance protein pelota [Nitrososphaeraceae archaeon]|jgi:protein pelota|nr:mRNA surveillance protein pelota [Nitrososphaeraceae archaeon]
MIVKEVTNSSDKAYFVISEDADDLFSLRRIIEGGDYVIADSTRVIKQVGEYARPDKGERIKVRVSIRVENISFDQSIDRLRIAGIITASSNELVSKGTHHSLTLRVGDSITIDKGRKWSNLEINILRKSGDTSGFILIAIDTQEAAIAKLSGTHLEIIPNIYSGKSGKRYPQAVKKDSKTESFFEDIARTISGLLIVEKDRFRAIIFGPGETKRRFYNFLSTTTDIDKNVFLVLEGIDVAGEDGIYVFLRSTAMKEVMKTSKLASVSSIVDEIMSLVSKGENKFAIGIHEVQNSASIKAISNLVLSDSIFRTAAESEVIRLLNLLEGQGAKVYAVDSSTDIGMRVSALGGVVALLRYAIR